MQKKNHARAKGFGIMHVKKMRNRGKMNLLRNLGEKEIWGYRENKEEENFGNIFFLEKGKFYLKLGNF